MATIKAVIRKRTDKDGLAIVQIAVCHHQKTAYISTDIKVKACDFIGGILTKGTGYKTTNARILGLINDYEERLTKIDNVDAKEVLQIKDELCIEVKTPYHKVSECYKAYIEHLKPGNSKKSYITSQMVFVRFCKNHDVNIEAVDCRWVQKYDKWLHTFEPLRSQRRSKDYGMKYRIAVQKPKKEHYSDTTIASYLSHLKAVINYAISEGWVKYQIHPFAKTTIQTGNRRENILNAYDLKKLIDYKTDNIRYRKAVDYFLLSFYLGGANLADMTRFCYLHDEITFEREKVASRTKGRASVTLPLIPEAKAIASKYMDKDGYIIDKGKKVSNLTSDFCYCLKCVSMELKLDIGVNITFTSARKAFSQIGTNVGINDNYLNYLLGHSMQESRGMMNPYSKIQKELASKVLMTIVSLANEPDKIERLLNEKLDRMLEM